MRPIHGSGRAEFPTPPVRVSMCLVLFALDQHPRWRVVLAANRDEFYARPTARAAPWEDCRGVTAGRDLEAGGTWMGIGPGARWAALTNVRDLPAHRENARSRGDLPARYLCGRPLAHGGTAPAASPEDYAREAFRLRQDFNPFNLLVARGAEVWAVSSHIDAAERVPPGVHGLSNATLDVPWPKVRRGTAALARELDDPSLGPEPLFCLLRDAEPAAVAELPDTGVGVEKETMLSPVFIASPDYGTRVSTVLLLEASGEGVFVERATRPESPEAERAFEIGASGAGLPPRV